ncbi:hypothetical protein [Maize yellow striate virus]|uniref:Uncharacterized protein n=1 Tax=Maize yellow striate virus TaxID=1168550 RepID=A0A2D1GTP5_9RHAB|nr:hypothetical protein KM621_gp05 [Maize yellow striate virus]ATN96438.1 hypothetical protein [Maize yellow striate virus]ATN96448.1 hypothetical protein [Maize yellow striate virus]
MWNFLLHVLRDGSDRTNMSSSWTVVSLSAYAILVFIISISICRLKVYQLRLIVIISLCHLVSAIGSAFKEWT